MAEGHDDAGRTADDRSHDDSKETEWDEPWPSERVDENDRQSETERVPERSQQENSHSHVSRRETSRHKQAANGQESDDIFFAEGVSEADGWVDLGDRRPEEVLSRDTLPDDAIRAYTTDERPLHALVQFQWGVRVTMGALIAGLLGTWGFSSLGFDIRWGAALTGVFLLLGLVWIVLYYRRWLYQIRTDSIYLERGVVTHVRSLVPYVRIQHVDTKRSFFERMLGLSTLVVYTAGSRGADVTIPGLLPEEARDLQGRVKRLAIEAEGDDAL